nr:type 1 glutamine amidotransferase domain-containing protein [Allomuricauda sp.]
MFKKYKVLKWTLLGLGTLIAIVFAFGFWFMSLIPAKNETLESTTISDLAYLTENTIPRRGNILVVVTSTDTMGATDKSTGYELTELARAYYVFQANGYEVDIASPAGGTPPVVIDDEDMGPFDFAFLNDEEAQKKVSQTIPTKDVVGDEYQAIFFVGGKGAMFDFPDNKAIQSMVQELYQSNRVIGAVCHGPAALVNVKLDNGKSILNQKKVSSFTNDEELLLIPDAASIFPFLLQDKLTSQGALFEKGPMYLDKISHDGYLVTGQNPWSVWSVAETMIKQLGHTPKPRKITDEEHAVRILNTYHKNGKKRAKEQIEETSKDTKQPIQRVLIAKHSIIAAMQGNIGQFFDLIGLVSFAKKMEEQHLESP